MGGTAVFDTIPPGPDGAESHAELRERILGGFLVFHNPRIELLAEAFGIRHEDESKGGAWTTTGLYAQAAFTAGRLKPYYRFDLVDRSQDDPFFGPAGRGVEKHTVGLRVDPWSRLAVKLELCPQPPGAGRVVRGGRRPGGLHLLMMRLVLAVALVLGAGRESLALELAVIVHSQKGVSEVSAAEPSRDDPDGAAALEGGRAHLPASCRRADHPRRTSS